MAPDIAATPYDALLGPMPVTSLQDGIAQSIIHYQKATRAG